MHKIFSKRFIKAAVLTFTTLGILVAFRLAFATDDTSSSLGSMAVNITHSFNEFGQLMIAASYVAGIAFCIMAIFKFKKNRDNPTSVPMSQPISLLAIGIVLIFFPAIIKPAGTTLLGSSAVTQAGGFTGQATLPGGKTGSGS